VIGAVGNFTGLGFRLAVEMAISLVVAMTLRELARSFAAVRVGDPTPRLWGRMSADPRSWFEPFGSGIVPGLILILWMVEVLVIPAAYAKPAPIDPSRFRRTPRDVILVSCAGPAATLALGILAGLVVRILDLGLEPTRAIVVLAYTSMALTVFHLLPIPGLDGARMVALALPLPARETYRAGEKYLPLFVLVVLFVFSSLALGILTSITGALCNAAAGGSCIGFLSFG
jgi:Zn-dependent protease